MHIIIRNTWQYVSQRKSQDCPSKTLIDVLLSTGLVFFGTPHAGGNDGLVALGSVAARIAQSIHLQPSSDIVETLKKGSLFTDVLAEHWRQQLESYLIISFWESIGDVSCFSQAGYQT